MGEGHTQDRGPTQLVGTGESSARNDRGNLRNKLELIINKGMGEKVKTQRQENRGCLVNCK